VKGVLDAGSTPAISTKSILDKGSMLLMGMQRDSTEQLLMERTTQ